MDNQHNWLSAQVAEGEAASSRIGEKAGAVRDEWFKIGHAFLAAKQLYPQTQAFGEWLRASPLARWSDNDRACAMQLARKEEFARAALEGTDVSSARTMWDKVAQLLALASSQGCEVEADSIQDERNDIKPSEPKEIAETAPTRDENPDLIHVAPITVDRPQDLERTLGADDAAIVRGWFAKKLSSGKRPLPQGLAEMDEVKPVMQAVAAAVRSGDCIHADATGCEKFDVRMAFPHIPRTFAIEVIGQGLSWKKLSATRKGHEKSVWERLEDLNEVCRARSTYTVDKITPNGHTLRLRDKRHEDEIAHGARQWWSAGFWPGEQPKLKVHTNAISSPPAEPPVGVGAIVYYGMTLWPTEPTAWRDPDAASTPTKQDVDNAYWFVEELHRALVANGASHRTAARYIRNWSKYIGALDRPAAAASIMQDMAQGIDAFGLNPNSGLDLKNRMPARATKFAAEGW